MTTLQTSKDSANPQATATSIWDERYGKGDIVCTQEAVKGDPIDYTQHPFLYQHSAAKRLTGHLKGEPLRLMGDQFLKPSAKKALAIGVGLAFTEEWLVVCGYVDHMTTYEASAVAADQTRKRVHERGLSERMDVRSGDVTQAGLNDGEFDLVFVQAAIHHFYNIEEMYALFHRVLKPGGLLMFDEYVGPDHHLYDEHVGDMMDKLNDCLAPQYRFDVTHQAERTHVDRATKEWMLQMDPSEGVHSSRILPLTYQYFDVEYRGDYGGTFMRPFFVGILPNFDWNDPKDQTVARLLIETEALLVDSGAIPSYHTRIVARRRPQPLAPLSQASCERITCADWAGFGEFGRRTPPPKVEFRTPFNYSDDNWARGVGTSDEATAFFQKPANSRCSLTRGAIATFSDQSTRKVTGIDLNTEANTMIIRFEGDRLDPNLAGFPNSIMFTQSMTA